jgi:hypothetical protein
MFVREQWIAKVHQLVYPTVVGLDAQFKPSAEDADRGVAVISVPAQSDESRYFLVAKEFVSEDGAPGWMVGLSVKSADRNRPLATAEIHSLVSRSLHLGTDLDEVKTLVKEVHASIGASQPLEAPADALGERIDRAIRGIGRL